MIHAYIYGNKYNLLDYVSLMLMAVALLNHCWEFHCKVSVVSDTVEITIGEFNDEFNQKILTLLNNQCYYQQKIINATHNIK